VSSFSGESSQNFFSRNQKVLSLGKIPLTRQQALLIGIYPIQVPTMGKDKHKGQYFLVSIPYVPEEEKEAGPSDGKPPSVNCTSATCIQWGDHWTTF
jgi:hypothetical protein